MVVGNSTNLKDVKKVMTDTDCIVSLIGNVKVNNQYTNIMQDSHAYILEMEICDEVVWRA